MALDRDTVVQTALRVLDEVGLDGLTLKAIADELGVKPPALYWHFRNKRELLDEMATAVLAEQVRAGPLHLPEGRWQDGVSAYGRGLRQMLLRHRDGARMFSGTYLTDPALYSYMEASLRPLVEAGFSLSEAVSALSTIYCFVVGFTIEEQAAQGDPRYEPSTRAQRLDPEAFPLAAAAGRELFTNFDQRFETGLGYIVNGLPNSKI